MHTALVASLVFIQARLQPVPLIGGPSFLPLHVQVLLEGIDDSGDEKGEQYLLDFIPSNPSDPDTLSALMTGSYVPGKYRFRPHPTNLMKPAVDLADVPLHTPVTPEDIENFIKTQRVDLHLLTNNCWSFAINFSLWVLRRDDSHSRQS